MSDSDKKKPSENDIESPVDGPTPDWMKMATSLDSGPSLTEEDTPSWLKDIRSGKSVSDPATSAETADEPSSEMSDLERLLAEEGIDLREVTEDRPEGSEGMSARDWMISTSDDELIRRRIGGADTPLEEPEISSPAIAVPVSEAGQEPVSEMSDLERLLAEEGIDLGDVTEDRPEGSEGMSARDWMISTSDDELIRRRIGGVDTPLEEPAPTPAAGKPEPAAPIAESEIEDDGMVVEEDLPDWLREIDEDEAVQFEEVAAFGNEDDKIVHQEGLPDWLQDMDESEAVDLPAETVAGVSSEVAVAADEELPDWLGGFEETIESPQSTASSAGLNGEDDDKMVVEEDLPDWLREVDDEADEVSEIVAISEDDGMVVEEDLPDWLSDIADDDDVSADLDVEQEDETRVDEGLPDWLTDSKEPEALTFEAETPMSATPLAAADDEDDLPDWLREVQEESPARKSASTIDAVAAPVEVEDDDFDEDLPDWLREVQEDSGSDGEEPALMAESPTPAETEPVALDDEDLPDWLRDVDDEAVEDTGPDIPVTAAVQADEDDLPDWLKEVSEEEDIEETDFSSEDDTFIVGEDLPDWLNEIEAEGDEPFEPSEPSPEEAAEIVAMDELPDWLRETKDDDLGDTVEDEIASLPTAEAVAEPIEDDVSVEEEELPDWLKEETGIEALSEAAESEEAVSTEPAPEPVAVESQADESPAETEEAESTEELVLEPMPVAQSAPPAPARVKSHMPDWLKKLREGEPEETIEQPVTVLTAAGQLGVQTAGAIGAPAKFDRFVPQTLPQDSGKRLEMARKARASGEIGEAIPIYSSLVSHGAHLTSVIEDLQQSIKVYPTNYMLYQVMGDAMIKDGRLQNALEAYRQALKKLTG